MSKITSANEPAEGGASLATLDAPTIADICNELHYRARAHVVSGLEDAILCGEHLLTQKSELKHGEFQRWIEENVDFSYSSAKAYMRAATAKGQGLPFSSLAQLYAPKPDNDVTEKTPQEAKRPVANPTPLDAEIIQLNADLERMQLPLMSPEAWIGRVGRDFLTERAQERLEWLVGVADTLASLKVLPGG